MHDIIIIGAGPAGLTAALYALRAGKSVLVLEKSTFGGQMTFSPKIENYPGFLAASGNEIADRLVDQVLTQGAELELEEVLAVHADGVVKTVETDCGVHEARSVIIASGAKHRLLGVPGEEGLVGNGISFCAVCDGAFYRDRDVAVIGGGNSAAQEAILLAETSRSVTILQNLDALTCEGKLREALDAKENVRILYGTTVQRFLGESSLEGVVARNEKTGTESTLSFDGVFVAIGLAPENKPFEPIADLDKVGYILADETCRTKTPGIFVAGDCRTKAVRQITTAASDGAIAALSSCAYVDAVRE